MSIVGEELKDEIREQIKARQTLHGSGKSTLRNSNQLKVLNTQNSWIKLASGVTITPEKANELGYPNLSGEELAKKYILFNGTSTFSENGESLAQKGNFLPGTYTRGEFGIVPMPGIENLTVKTLNRGSLKKATLKLKVHDRKQFEVIEVLYLRLGYTVLVEWGNNIYTKTGTDLQTIGNTIIENDFFSDKEGGLSKGKTHFEGLNAIDTQRLKHNGNYDGFFAKISNFEWVFNDDGSYDITLTLISLGDVIESLKSNISISPQFIKFQDYTDTSSTGPTKEQKEGRSKSQLHALLWVWEYLNSDNTRKEYTEKQIVRNNAGQAEGYLMHKGGKELDATQYSVWHRCWYTYGKDEKMDSNKRTPDVTNKIHNLKKADGNGYPVSTTGIYTYSAQDMYGPQYIKDRDLEMQAWIAYVGKYIKKWDDWETEAEEDLNSNWDSVKSFISVNSTTSINPLIGAPLSHQDGFRTTHKGKPFCYIRFGALLEYIKQKLIPKIKSERGIPFIKNDGVPLFDIQTDASLNGTIMYTVPNQQSNDLKKCLIRQKYTWPLDITDSDGVTHKKGNYYTMFNELAPFRTLDVDISGMGEEKKNYQHANIALPLNIYLNFDFVREVLDSNTDKDGNVSIFSLIKGLCDGINVSLGGINNLEPIISETKNKLHIVDTTPIPGRIKNKGRYKLNLFGYNNDTSNFVRKLNIKTAITPEYATMITVGATAGGNIKGTDATSFAKWNNGIIDKFKPELEAGDEESSKSFPADPVVVYTEKILKDWTASRYNASDNKPFSSKLWDQGVDQDKIDQNRSIITEFLKYSIARKNQLSPGGSSVSGGIGFIPFKISLTLDGISGVKIYNVLHIDSSFLPKVYGDSLDFIVTGISHKISNNDWETDLEVTVMPKSDLKTGVIENYDYLFNEEANAALEAAAASSSAGNNKAPNQQPVPPTRNPEKAKGTTGTIGNTNDKSNLSPGALTSNEINKIIKDSGGKTSLRKRIVGIAASYVGQSELPGNNQGWHDQRFEDKLKTPNVTDKGWGWYAPEPWCAWFVSRVMYEAHVVGNSILGPGDDKSKSIWKNRYKEGANIKPFSAGVLATETYFKNTLKRDVRRAKAIKNPDLIQPGDIVYYNASHIGIVVKINKDSKGKLKSLDIVNGNTKQNAKNDNELRDGGTTALARNYSINKIRGFSRLFES